MHSRYTDPRIESIWSDANRLNHWQDTEFAVILGNVALGKIPKKFYRKIRRILKSKPIDLDWWRARDKEIHHDLNAFLDERLRYLPPDLQQFLHQFITSYDTEEPAFARMLVESLAIVDEVYDRTKRAIVFLALKYRFLIKLGKTHGQDAELQTFGKRCLTWLRDLEEAYEALAQARQVLKYSKISGAIGNYGAIDPELEKKALKILGFEPYYGATQIMPRVLYVPLADALSNIVQVLDKVATDIRLNARGGRPLMREPFGKKQKGSSAMPQKKNQVRSENEGGMARMAAGYSQMIHANIQTWEERDISQSSVERVAWADLFHVTVNALKGMVFILEGLNVYPDNIAQEVYEARGTYATAEVKEFLKRRMAIFGLSTEDAYRIVQLAAFNVFEPSQARQRIRATIPSLLSEGAALIDRISKLAPDPVISIQDFIPAAELRVSNELEITGEMVAKYNECLRLIFAEKRAIEEWNWCFNPLYLLRHEAILYEKILGE
ncbi:MAG: lyase family protein [Patescibacteria group bacterium]